jgi:hypothetical protein
MGVLQNNLYKVYPKVGGLYMEKRSNLVLRHKQSGLFFDRMADHSSKLWMAWRFPDAEYLQVWFETHGYAPDPNEYEPIEIELTIAIKEVMRNVQNE